MNGLGGLNKSLNGVVIGVVQLQLPVVVTRAYGLPKPSRRYGDKLSQAAE